MVSELDAGLTSSDDEENLNESYNVAAPVVSAREDFCLHIE
jgi:hypothetical protein